MSYTVKKLTEQCSFLAGDEDLENVQGHEWLDWINDAQLAVSLVRPDAKTDTSVVQLAESAKQTLLVGSRRLMGISRNMGVDGATPGKAIRGPVPTETLDSQDPNWMTTSGSEVQEFAYSEAIPDIYWVYPYPNNANVYVELLVAKIPTNVSDHDSTVDLGDQYIPAIIEWVMYRIFSRDSETTPNWTRSARHFQAFFNLLNVKMQADMAISPKVIERTR